MNENLIYSRISEQHLESAWIDAMPWIEKALGEVNHDHAELIHIQKGLMAGFLQLWSIQDKRKANFPICFLITELHCIGEFKTLIVRWLAGVEMAEWINEITLLEQIAEREGYHKVEIWGRPGWEKVLKPHGYEREFIILGKLIKRGLN
jgi:hypothetical protein